MVDIVQARADRKGPGTGCPRAGIGSPRSLLPRATIPVESLIAIAQDPATEPKRKANIAKELLNYIAPRQKASETRIEEDKTVTVMIQSYSERQPGALEQGPVVDVLGQGCC